MKSVMKTIFIGLLFLFSLPVLASSEHNPLLSKVMIDQLELSDDSAHNWEAQAWIGNDAQKLWLKTEGERENQHTKNAEFQLLYDKPIAEFWDLQVGWRQDIKPESRNWLTLGVQGLAPYWIESNLALFVGENNRVAVRAKGEYEFLITQRWILIPDVELNAGNVMADLQLGVRLHYLIVREFMPYVGIQWEKTWKPEADESGAVVMGVRMWF